jgi:hypothetical protein
MWTFLDDKKRARSIEARVRAGVRSCAGHPAVLCYAIGNEIPAPIVRWYGKRLVEQYLERLYRAAKQEDPEGLVTYVNYPTTEYLQLPFLDLCVSTSTSRRKSVLRPIWRVCRILLVTALYSWARSGSTVAARRVYQADVLDWQIRTIFAGGCAGTFVFAWTDEWHRGGHDIQDWDFGLTDRQRCPKPALTAVCNAFADVPFPQDLPGPIFRLWCVATMERGRSGLL